MNFMWLNLGDSGAASEYTLASKRNYIKRESRFGITLEFPLNVTVQVV